MVGERGQGLSGGERQRQSIARALLIDPHPDPRRSHLLGRHRDREGDPEGARQPGAGPHHHRHRAPLSTLRRADRLVVMDRGRVVEVGTRTTNCWRARAPLAVLRGRRAPGRRGRRGAGGYPARGGGTRGGTAMNLSRDSSMAAWCCKRPTARRTPAWCRCAPFADGPLTVRSRWWVPMAASGCGRRPGCAAETARALLAEELARREFAPVIERLLDGVDLLDAQHLERAYRPR